MGKLELLYGGFAINDIIIDMKNGDRMIILHYKDFDTAIEKIIFSYKHYHYDGDSYEEYSRLEVLKDINPAIDRFLTIDPGMGMLSIGSTECTKSSRDSQTYEKMVIKQAYNFNYDDFGACYVNVPFNMNQAEKDELLSKVITGDFNKVQEESE